MEHEYIRFISMLFPFKNLKDKTIESIFSEINYSICEFSKSDIIFSKTNFSEKIGFIIEGECEVEKIRGGENSISLNTLSKYASFGILSILSPNAEYPTQIRARKKTTVLFIPGDDMLSVIKKYTTVSMNVITFLATRIEFLNNKISEFSGKSTAQKLATYLLVKFNECGNRISISRTKIASELGVGRASVYRDLDLLVEKKLIEIQQKEIIIISPEGLERI